MSKSIFEEIYNKYPANKRIATLCKLLMKKCSFDNGKDAENLCHLAYLLYIYGEEETALAVSAYTHDAPFPGRVAFNVWSFILDVWGLECYILQKQGQTEASLVRADEIDRINRLPVGERMAESVSTLTDKIRIRICYEEELCYDKIASAGTTSLANKYRLAALFHMIGWGATGHYPDLNLHRKELEKNIQDYVSVLLKA